MGEADSVNRKRTWLALVLAVVVLLSLGAIALAEGTISTTVVMRVSRMTQNAVVDAGEDLSMEVNIDGVEPSAYQWYFEGQAIPGANQKVYNIVNAQVEDSGVYRMDAFDADGRMVVSMDISARVIDPQIPQSGDHSLPLGVALAGFVAAGAALALLARRRANA